MVVGVAVGFNKSSGTIAIAIGSALVAAAVLAWISAKPDDLLDDLLDSGLRETFSNRRVHCDDAFWLRLLDRSKDHYFVLGVANHGYIHDAQAREQFSARIDGRLRKDKHFRFHILWLHPECKHAELREVEERRRTRADTVDSIQWMWGIREGLPAKAQERLTLATYEETPTCGITWAGDEVVVTHYLARALNQVAPGLILSANPYKWPWTRVDPALTDKYIRCWKQVVENQTVLTADLVRDLVDKRPTYDPEARPSEGDLRNAATGDEDGEQ